jgi:hypothetical protein
MAFYNKYTPDELLWLLLRSSSGETVSELSSGLNSLAKSERALTDSFFSKVIDQSAFNTPDYQRFRKFLVEWNAAHKAITTTSAKMSDPRIITNDDLDELFRSFGFPYSTTLRGPTSDSLPQKVNLFLDLVNLYKRKGTPQALFEVLQYFGVTDLDIFEFFLKFNKTNALTFYGDAVAGSTPYPSTLRYPYDSLTATDPHWLLTEDQIRSLHSSLKINLPSKTSYLGVRPNAVVDGPEFSIYSKIVQDQYYNFRFNNITPDNNAEISVIGEVHSLLELHLATLYIFNRLYDIGTIGDQFICYDGSNLITDLSSIIAEYNAINIRPSEDYIYGSRLHREYLLNQYYDKFCRIKSRNFLQTRDNVETILNQIDSTIIPSLNNVTETLQEILFLLLKDIANWIRNNVGYGFINFGFIIFGLDSFFSDLKQVMNFFKPYRARLLFLEALQVKSKLFESINIEEEFEYYPELELIDRLVGDSHPCCVSNREIIESEELLCNDSAESYHSREYYDCGSYFDIGAVTDIKTEVFIEVTEIPEDSVKCRYDSNAVMTHNMIVAGSDPTHFMPDDDNEEGSAVLGETSTTLQTSGLADFDYNGCFDNVNGFEVVYITIEQLENENPQ